MPIQQLNNYVQTTLASAVTSGATDWPLASVAGLPTTGNFMLRIDDAAPATTFEIVECTAVNVGTGHVTVTRGQEGTTGIAHNAGAIVGNDITAGMIGRISGQNQLKARAYITAVQSLATSGSWAKILLDTKSYDLNTNFDAVTNHVWTCPLAGYYWLSGQVQHAATTGRVGARIVKNGLTVLSSALFPPQTAGNTDAVVAADIQLLAVNDTIELQGYQESGAAANVGNTSPSTFLVIAFHSAP